MKEKVVYLWIRKSTGLPFYVGCGSESRVYDTLNRSSFFKSIIENEETEVKIIGRYLDINYAYEEEKKLIQHYSEIVGGLDIEGNEGNPHRLANKSTGGHGRTGTTHKPNIRKKDDRYIYVIFDTGEMKEFKSAEELSRYLETSPANISNLMKKLSDSNDKCIDIRTRKDTRVAKEKGIVYIKYTNEI